MNAKKLAIYDTRDGRTIVGYANSIGGAARVVRKLVSIPPEFRLRVWRRSDAVRECLGLADGYCYAISYEYAGRG